MALVEPVAVVVTVGGALVLFAYDLIANLNKSPDDSVGSVVVETCRRNPLLIFVAGVVCGHLFWHS